MYLCRFIGVGRVSDPALTMKDSWPEGMPSMISLQKWFSASGSVMIKNLFWTQSEENFWFQPVIELIFRDCLIILLRAFSDVGVLDWDVHRQVVASVGISCLFRNAGLSIRLLSSIIALSDDARMG